jgi:hypothetical protein
MDSSPIRHVLADLTQEITHLTGRETVLTGSDTPRRTAVCSLVASGLALVGLHQSIRPAAAKKKKKKKHNNPPNPPGPPAVRNLKLVNGTNANFLQSAPGQWTASSTCPKGAIPTSREISLNILNVGAGNFCWQFLDSPSNPVGWLTVVKCVGTAVPDGFLVAWCLQVTES